LIIFCTLNVRGWHEHLRGMFKFVYTIVRIVYPDTLVFPTRPGVSYEFNSCFVCIIAYYFWWVNLVFYSYMWILKLGLFQTDEFIRNNLLVKYKAQTGDWLVICPSKHPSKEVSIYIKLVHAVEGCLFVASYFIRTPVISFEFNLSNIFCFA